MGEVSECADPTAALMAILEVRQTMPALRVAMWASLPVCLDVKADEMS